jgi:hypothetical protein
VALISEALEDPWLSAEHCAALQQKANGFTKIVPPIEWSMMLKQLGFDYKLT